MRNPDKYWNPYLAGVAMGLVLLAAYLFVGKGLGASGPALRFATAAVEAVAPAPRRGDAAPRARRRGAAARSRTTSSSSASARSSAASSRPTPRAGCGPG